MTRLSFPVIDAVIFLKKAAAAMGATSNSKQMQRSIRVVVKMPGEAAEERTIKNSTTAMKQIVGSPAALIFGTYLCPIFDEKRGLALVVDNANRKLGDPNLLLREDVVMGPAIIVRYDQDTQQQRDLTDAQVATVLAWCDRADHQHSPSRRPRLPETVVWGRSQLGAAKP